MCDPGERPGVPAGTTPAGPTSPPTAVPGSAGEAAAMVLAGLTWLADADMTAVPAAVQADCLRDLERAVSVHTAARARVLTAFTAGPGIADDGCRSARSWLAWQTRTTPAAASAALGWTRRLHAHPAVSDALRRATISASWARQICDWTDLLPESARQDADVILLAAAAGGADLTDLARLAEHIRATLARPDTDPDDDGFTDRRLRLATTIGGIGKLDGNLTPRCAAALQAVLDALGKRTGPEDLRTPEQRQHDALEDACRRLIAAGGLPDRARQPTQIQLHITLDDLTRRLTDPDDTSTDDTSTEDTSAEDITSRLGPRLTPDTPIPPEPLPGPAAMPGDECDATIVPIVTGRVDYDLLDKLTAQLTRHPGWLQYQPGQAAPDRDAIKNLILANAIALLSGPDGLASVLRTGTLPPPAASISLPLDVGTSTDTIPPHLRRAVILRDQHCRGPGCTIPAAGCQIHHVIPRSRGGPTKLTAMILLCPFHHLIMMHGMPRSRLLAWRP
jgi:hypothetical protein